MRARRKVHGDHRDDVGPACAGMAEAIREMSKGGTAEDALKRRTCRQGNHEACAWYGDALRAKRECSVCGLE